MSTNVRWALLGLIVLTALFALFMMKAVATTWDLIGIHPIQLIGARFTVADAIGVAVAAFAGALVWMKAQWRQVSVEIVAELRKVTWPNRDETKASTRVVVVTVLIIAAILGIFDFFFSWFTDVIYAA